MLLGSHIRRLEAIGRALAEVEAAIGATLHPFAAQRALLVTIRGVGALAAAVVAEIGAVMAAFGTASASPPGLACARPTTKAGQPLGHGAAFRWPH